MTPLVDVVMVILIFLMLAGSFGGVEHYLTSNMPVKENGPGGTPPQKGMIPDEPLEIRVDASMAAAASDDPANDSYSVRVGQIAPTADLDQLRASLVAMREKLNAAGKANDRIQVVIAPGRFVKYRTLIAVYQTAMEANFTKIAFSTSH